MKKYFLLASFCLPALLGLGQARFYNTVRIQYEKTVAVKALYKEIASDWYERIKDQLPQSSLSYYEFVGDTAHSLYRQSKETPYDPKSFYRPIGDNNVVYNDYRKGITISQKPIFEETFLLQDSLLNIKWKLTGDTRIIAGFECRKAVGILFDTVAVFAFYTDELTVTGGPEGIQGLPGMILGMGIPRLHTTWFATQVQVVDVKTQSLAPATKGKKVDRQTMFKSLDKVLKDWEYGKKLILATMI
ncbi:MAG TPA: GLPGLI family protein [Chitinophagaceae bacterium]|nr:GLPGLI family protein [Chitinophagaceae bacterium]